MNDKISTLLLELLRYPVIALSVLLLLLGVRYWIGMEFGLVTEVSTEGIKFAEKKSEETYKALTSLESRLNEVSLELEEVKKALPSGTNFNVPAAKLLEASETVSDQTANIEKIAAAIPDKDAELIKGYIWIGSYDTQGWHNPRLAYKDSGQKIEGEPSKLTQGTEFKVLGNMMLRAGPPENGKSIKDVKSLGVVPRGTIVRLTGDAVAKEQGERDPYWVSIEVPKKETK